MSTVGLSLPADKRWYISYVNVGEMCRISKAIYHSVVKIYHMTFTEYSLILSTRLRLYLWFPKLFHSIRSM